MQEKGKHKNATELWSGIINSDEPAFQQLFESKYADLLLFGLRICFDRALVKKLKEAFSQLTKKQKEIIELRFFKGCSYDEIATQTHTQKRTIYNQIHTALKILKKSMLLSSLLIFLQG